jgi:HAD superfamily phosphoserine phosphatase-like hydrolase
VEKFKNIELFIFDLDGTICKLDIDWDELKNFLRKKYGTDLNFEYLDVGIENLERKLGEKAKKEAYEIVRKYELRGVKKLKPIKKVLKLIKILKQQNKTLAIFSSNLKETVEKALKKLKIIEDFEIIISKEDVKKHKPSCEGLKKIIKLSKVSKEKVIYIGDKKKDLEAGKRAGIKTILVSQI